MHDVDGKAAADVLRKNVNMPLDQLTRNTVKSHQRYSSLGAWQIQGKKGDKSALEKRSFLLNPVDIAHVDKAHVDESPTKEHSPEKQVDKIDRRQMFTLADAMGNISMRTIEESMGETSGEGHPLFGKHPFDR